MPIETNTCNLLLDYMWDNGSGPAFVDFCGLCTGAPGDSDTTTNNELSAGTYSARKGVTWNAPTSLSNGAQCVASNTQTWSPTGADTITWFVLDDQNTPGAGHRFYQQLTYPLTTVSGTDFYFRDGRLKINLTGNTYAQDTAKVILDILCRGNTGSRVLEFSSAIALSETVPNADGTNFTELSGSNYARVGFNYNDVPGTAVDATSFGLLGRAIYNTVNLTFPIASADWNPVTGWGIFSASTGGFFRAGGPLDSTVTVKSGETSFFRVQEFIAAMY